MTERPDPAKVIPGPDPGACPSCGEWRKSGMIHNCGNNPVNDPAKVIAEALAEKLHWLADPERAQELAEAVLAALAAAGFPVGEPRDERLAAVESALLTVLREAAIIAGSHDQGDRRGWTAEEVEKQASLIPQLAAAGRLILAEAVKARSVTVDDILAALAEQGEPDAR